MDKAPRMNKMKFDVACVREYLLKHGLVYTIRSYETKSYETDYVFVDSISQWCQRTKIGEVIHPEDLSPFVSQSGFTSANEWLSTFAKLSRVSTWKYLYRVSLCTSAPTASESEHGNRKGIGEAFIVSEANGV